MNFSVAAGEPSPCSHLATQSVVAFAICSVGPGLPKHSALQEMSVNGQALTHFCCSVVTVGLGAAVAEVVDWAAAKEARLATVRMVVVNFMVLRVISVLRNTRSQKTGE